MSTRKEPSVKGDLSEEQQLLLALEEKSPVDENGWSNFTDEKSFLGRHDNNNNNNNSSCKASSNNSIAETIRAENAGWNCPCCTFNNLIFETQCELCCTKNPSVKIAKAPSSSKISGWECDGCTFVNNDGSNECQICGTAKTVKAVVSSLPEPITKVIPKWDCISCTLENDINTSVCSLCDTKRACESWTCKCTVKNVSTLSKCIVCGNGKPRGKLFGVFKI